MRVFIPITQGQVLIIDYEDYDLVKQYKWSAAHRGSRYYVETRRNRTKIHRLIMNCPKGMVVDHIDGNLLNNCRSNLRICSVLENNMNRSGFKGVTKLKDCNRWRARIRLKGILTCLGLYNSPEKAHNAYCIAANIHFKQFANSGE